MHYLKTLILAAAVIACWCAVANAADPEQDKTASEVVQEAVDTGSAVVVQPAPGEPVVFQPDRNKALVDSITQLVIQLIALIAGVTALVMTLKNSGALKTETAHSRTQDRRMDAANIPPGDAT